MIGNPRGSIVQRERHRIAIGSCGNNPAGSRDGSLRQTLPEPTIYGRSDRGVVNYLPDRPRQHPQALGRSDDKTTGRKVPSKWSDVSWRIDYVTEGVKPRDSADRSTFKPKNFRRPHYDLDLRAVLEQQGCAFESALSTANHDYAGTPKY